MRTVQQGQATLHPSRQGAAEITVGTAAGSPGTGCHGILICHGFQHIIGLSSRNDLHLQVPNAIA